MFYVMNSLKYLHFALQLNAKLARVPFCAQYSSLKGRKSRYERFLYKTPSHEDTEDAFDEDMLKQIEDTQYLQEALKVEEKKHHIRKFKTLERKYFKPPQEINLLTWDGKEQIRYLHQEYPNEWTIEKLAESFPVSIDGVQRLLRSKYVPKSLKGVISHDKKAKSNWLYLKDGSAKSGPIDIRFERLFTDGKIKNLQFAAGNKALPQPKNVSDSRNNRLGSGCSTDGLFASIVKDYVEKKKNSKMIQENTEQKKELQKPTDDNLKLLSEISGKSHAESFTADATNGNLPSEINNTEMFKYRDWNVKLDSNPEKGNHSDAEDVVHTSVSNKRFPHGRKPTNLLDKLPQFSVGNERVTIDESQQVLSKQTMGRPLARKRGNWQSQQNSLSQSDRDLNLDHDQDDISDTSVKEKYELYKNLSYDYPSRNGKTYSEKEAYLYDPQTGYQYPFGKVDRSLENIEIPQNDEFDSNKNRLYKRGNNYYDEDGEFLFKVP